MKKVRVFKPARAEQKPSTRWHNRPRARRERTQFCAGLAADIADRVVALARLDD
ncbi:hypothetical protein [Burkholderia gladioli]|uniref:hypothetical protein n=1 Tax=Burkholderia gladioli TaxID=28095 RepID=UPI00163ED2A0|nr:hypothetical protein [Burkholderia gladioli]